MTNIQKIIKYCAIVLAIYLIVKIFSVILIVLLSVSSNSSDKPNPIKEVKIKDINIDRIKKLSIDLNYSKVKIENGKIFNVKTNSKKIKIYEKNHKLIIKDTSKNLFDKKTELKITIPNNTNYDKVTIDVGASDIKIDSIKTSKLILDIGAGKVKINNISVLDKADIEVGAGKLDILSGDISNLDLELGAGSSTISTILKSKSSIDLGTGSINLNLNDNFDNYKFIFEDGISDIKLNNKSIPKNKIIGTGVNVIKIDGGLGKIKINTK